MNVGYVLKRYPLLSQTFIVNELLAHEAAGLALEVFSLRAPKAEPRHAAVSRVEAAVTYVPQPDDDGTSAALTREIERAARVLPRIPRDVAACGDEELADIHQAVVLARLAIERGLTHLHAHFGNVATTVARLAGHFAGLPYTFTAHARDIFHETVVPEALARKLADARAIVTVSEFNARHLRVTYGNAAARVVRIYNGLDLSRFPYSWPVHRPSAIVSVGRLIEKKGFAVLVDACRVLADRGRTFRCVIIGAGPLEQALRAHVVRLGLDGVVELAGARAQDDAMRLVQDAAVFAAPCVVGDDGDRDGLPTVLLEAMALGTPCVSTDVTGIPEIVRDGETGLLVRQHDAKALAVALERLLDDASLRERLAAAARRLIENEFDIHRNTARMRAVFAAASASA